LFKAVLATRLFKDIGGLTNRPRSRELGREKVIAETGRNFRIKI
jgi:hypothetical protein